VRGEEARFRLRFRNDRPEAVEAIASVSILDGEGAPVADLPRQALSVGSGAEAAAEFTWVADAEGGPYRAEAMVVVGGETYGPAMRPFSVGYRLTLPLAIGGKGAE